MIKIEFKDAVKFMKTLPDNSVDLIISDVPYGVNYKYNHITGYANFKDDKETVEKLAKECCAEFKRILKPQAHIYLYIGQTNPIWTYEIYKQLKLNNIISVYNYSRPEHPKKNYRYDNQLIIFGSKGTPRYFYKFPDPRSLRQDLNGNIKRKDNQNEHPCAKNKELIKKFIIASSPENGVVLDCFVGGGSTIQACIETNRNFIGCENNKEYYDNLIKKFKSEF